MNYSVVSYISLAAAAIGGALGAYWATVQRPKSKTPTRIVEIIIGTIAASGVVDKYIGHSSIPFAALVGIPVGVASGFLLDAAAELMPSIVKKAIRISVEYLPNFVREVLKLIIESKDK